MNICSGVSQESQAEAQAQFVLEMMVSDSENLHDSGLDQDMSCMDEVERRDFADQLDVHESIESSSQPEPEAGGSLWTKLLAFGPNLQKTSDSAELNRVADDIFGIEESENADFPLPPCISAEEARGCTSVPQNFNYSNEMLQAIFTKSEVIAFGFALGAKLSSKQIKKMVVALQQPDFNPKDVRSNLFEKFQSLIKVQICPGSYHVDFATL